MAVKDREKISTYFFEINDTRKLEEAAKHLQLSQLKEIFSDIQMQNEEQQNKLLPIFVGIPHELFCQLLSTITSEELELLRGISTTEPLRHHLTLLVHELSYRLKRLEEDYEKLFYDIDFLQVTEYNQEEVHLKYEKIEQLKKNFQVISSSASQAMQLSWSSSRLDLIDSLSRFKEKAELCIENALGHPQKNETPPTGLYLLLQKKQFSIYEKVGSIEGLRDDEPAIEALALFGLWYVSDYQSVGLLQNFSSNEKKVLPDSYQNAAENLSQYGLKTIHDLKKANIFSKKTLKAYLTLHQLKQT